MPLEDGSLIRASGPKVFFVSSEGRRWVPDPQTLLALAPGGWSAVRRVSDADLTAIPEGPPLPSRRDGALYRGGNRPEVYLLEGGARRHVPDLETLRQLFGGWSKVKVITQQDCDAIPLGAAIPSVKKPPTEDAGQIDVFLRSLPNLPVPTPGLSRTGLPGVTMTFDDIPYDAKPEHVSKTRVLESIAAISPVADVLYPGSLVQGRSVESGRLAPVPLPRAGGTITVTTDLASDSNRQSASRELGEVSLAELQDARAMLLKELNPSDSATAIQYASTQARTLEHGLLNLGVDFKSPVFDANLSVGLDQGVRTSTAMVLFQQFFYTVAFTPPATARPFFGDTVTLADVQKYAELGNPPCYLSQVDYGRSLTVAVTGSESWTNLSMAVTAAIKAAAVSGHVDIDAQHKEMLSRSQVRVLASGGAGAVAVRLLEDPLGQLPAYLGTGGPFTPDNPGAPLRYTVRHTGSRDVVSVALATQFDETADVTGRSAQQGWLIWDGAGGGPRQTDLLVAAGDRLSISAQGQNYSGVWLTGPYGPDGWTDWERPSGSGFPLPDKHPFALCGTYGSTDVANGEWFYIGSGLDTTVAFRTAGPAARRLCLGTNDNNPLNGDPRFKFSVNVQVTRRTKEELKLVGVGRSE